MSSDREAIEQASACAFRIAIDQWAIVGDMRCTQRSFRVCRYEEVPGAQVNRIRH